MRTLRTKAELRAALAAPRHRGATIGLVPTMGAFHEGHLVLMRRARAACNFVVVSLFVNPTQFGAEEDLGSYPRDEARDADLAGGEGVDLLYAPSVEEMYPPGFSSAVEVEGLTEVLCGAPGRRGPEHFRGVTTVVAKLFNTVQPDFAFFGQKDAQQALVITRMARDLDMPVRVEVIPTVRDQDGLALSSRNTCLGEGEREPALAIPRALRAAEAAVAGGETSAGAVLTVARGELEVPELDLEYLEARDASDLAPIETFDGRPVLVAIAARVGTTRLIDNTIIEPEGRTS